MEKLTKYDKALMFFTDGECETSWTYEPRPHFDWVIATNRMVLIRVNRKLTVGEYSEHKYQPIQMNNVFPEPDCSLVLPVNECLAAIYAVPEFEQVEVTGNEAECEECGGTGRVTWHYETEDGTEYSRFDDCPVCDGRGSVNKKQLFREQRYIGINGVCYRIGDMLTILRTIKFLGHESATVRHMAPMQTMLIRVEPGVDMLIMSNRTKDTVTPVCNITIKPTEG